MFGFFPHWPTCKGRKEAGFQPRGTQSTTRAGSGLRRQAAISMPACHVIYRVTFKKLKRWAVNAQRFMIHTHIYHILVMPGVRPGQCLGHDYSLLRSPALGDSHFVAKLGCTPHDSSSILLLWLQPWGRISTAIWQPPAAGAVALCQWARTNSKLSSVAASATISRLVSTSVLPCLVMSAAGRTCAMPVIRAAGPYWDPQRTRAAASAHGLYYYDRS